MREREKRHLDNIAPPAPSARYAFGASEKLERGLASPRVRRAAALGVALAVIVVLVAALGRRTASSEPTSRRVLVTLPFTATHVSFDDQTRELTPPSEVVVFEVPRESGVRHRVTAVALDGARAEAFVREADGVARPEGDYTIENIETSSEPTSAAAVPSSSCASTPTRSARPCRRSCSRTATRTAWPLSPTTRAATACTRSSGRSRCIPPPPPTSAHRDRSSTFSRRSTIPSSPPTRDARGTFEKMFLEGRPPVNVGVTSNGDVFGGTQITFGDVLGDQQFSVYAASIQQVPHVCRRLDQPVAALPVRACRAFPRRSSSTERSRARSTIPRWRRSSAATTRRRRGPSRVAAPTASIRSTVIAGSSFRPRSTT